MNALQQMVNRNEWGKALGFKIDRVSLKWGDLRTLEDAARVFTPEALEVDNVEVLLDTGNGRAVWIAVRYSPYDVFKRMVPLHLGDPQGAIEGQSMRAVWETPAMPDAPTMGDLRSLWAMTMPGPTWSKHQKMWQPSQYHDKRNALAVRMAMMMPEPERSQALQYCRVEMGRLGYDSRMVDAISSWQKQPDIEGDDWIDTAKIFDAAHPDLVCVINEGDYQGDVFGVWRTEEGFLLLNESYGSCSHCCQFMGAKEDDEQADLVWYMTRRIESHGVVFPTMQGLYQSMLRGRHEGDCDFFGVRVMEEFASEGMMLLLGNLLAGQQREKVTVMRRKEREDETSEQ